MERRPFSPCWIVVGALAAIAGCGQSSGAKPSGSASGATAPQAAGSPAETVRNFLVAVRRRNDAEARMWLTALAREKAKDMDIAPPGSDTAEFEVGDVEMVEGGAHVASTWSDLDADNVRQKEPIVWIVANEPEGWRICGMATTVFEERLPLVLNFEDPEEMQQKQQMIEAEAARRTAHAARASQAPGAPAGQSPATAAGAPASVAAGPQGVSPGSDDTTAPSQSATSASPDRQAMPGPATAGRNSLRDGKR